MPNLNIPNGLDKVKAWPMVEACRLYQHLKGKTPEKGYVLFETGYGPSGLPHIGTFGEVVRTCLVQFAFSKIDPSIPTKLFCTSDDYDGLRKVPLNIPNRELIEKSIGLPLSAVPDPFGTCASYGENMNSRLQNFLNNFGFRHKFISAAKKYKTGALNEVLKEVTKNYDKLKKLIADNVGEERAETYSPLMPISKTTGRILAKGVRSVDQNALTIKYTDESGQERTNGILNGECKMQWKIDFGARWRAFEVDYEIFGKDHLANQKLYTAVCRILGGKPPLNFCYELFLGEDGSKISKSKGNGISIDEWLEVAPKESLAFFMFQKPKTAKRLCFDVIPKSVDEYITYATKYHEETPEKQLENPVYYIHYGEVPKFRLGVISYSLLLNLVSACNPENDSILWGFIEKYDPTLSKGQSQFLDSIVNNSITYYNKFIKPHKNYRSPNAEERQTLLNLKEKLLSHSGPSDAKTLQTMVYEIGKESPLELKDWFGCIYQVLLGQDQGPRVGSFIAIYGPSNMISLIDSSIKNLDY